MTGTPSFFDTPQAVIPVVSPVFTTATGNATAPATVNCVVTAPQGVAGGPWAFTYAGATGGVNAIYAPSTGKYELDFQPYTAPSPPASAEGLWQVTWVGTGGSVASTVQVFTSTFRVFSTASLTGQQRWYAGLAEMKSRLGVPYAQVNAVTQDDYEMTTSLQVASGAINRYCATHFFQVTEARTFAPLSIYHLPVDQVVPGSITQFALDYNGYGTFDTIWAENVNYQVYQEGHQYNKNRSGITEPFDFVEVLLGTGTAGGQFFPFTWPFSHKDRVKITATWGWPEIPPEVNQACLLLAVDIFKAKDAPWGIAGSSEVGMVRIQQSPWIVDLLHDFVFAREKVGV